ncbi:hypothetical protein SLEP1_g35331 [Rubroshorea leprosula]|uniref:Uncharacterized protein n=1 Tax=Rubroshorea leprosula TaxID=152421 RepID=A0AAV5KND1_9ROSI|nr:hypothetical protein SLEP1_g35331 [Rubroshorea leprosula]
MDMGPCPKVHSLQLRREYPYITHNAGWFLYFYICGCLTFLRYEEAKAKGIDSYDRELEDAIDRLIVECDRKIGRALKHLEDEDAKATIAISVSEVTQAPEVLELSKQIKKKLKEVDQYGSAVTLRKQLDLLMGAYRIGDVREVNRKYYDRDVCRLYLSSLWPHELFQLTAKGIDSYDRELEDAIDRLIVECDRKIGRALKHLEDEDAKATTAISISEVTQTPEVLELSKQIKKKLKEVDQYALEEVEELRTKGADKQSTLLLDAFKKDLASLPQPLPNPFSLAPLPVPAPDSRIQEMINEKLKKAEDLGEKGMVDEAQKALEEAEALKKVSISEFISAVDQLACNLAHCGGGTSSSMLHVKMKRETRAANLTGMMTGDRKKEAEIMRENQVGTETKGIAMTEGGIVIVGAEIVTGIAIKIVIEIMSALGLIILEVVTGHIQGLGNVPGIMIATGVTDTRCMNAAKKKMNTKLFLLR